MALTEVRIKSLVPCEKRYTVSDDRGLSLEVMPSGILSWREIAERSLSHI